MMLDMRSAAVVRGLPVVTGHWHNSRSLLLMSTDCPMPPYRLTGVVVGRPVRLIVSCVFPKLLPSLTCHCWHCVVNVMPGLRNAAVHTIAPEQYIAYLVSSNDELVEPGQQNSPHVQQACRESAASPR
jgi:hypothetical protein